MTVRRSIAAAVFSLVILLALGAIVFVYAVNNTQTTTVYAFHREVFVGQQADPADVVAVTVKASGNEYQYAYQDTQAALGGRVYLSHRQIGDILANDDIGTQKQPALVSLSIATSPPLAAGDDIDVYTTQGTQQVLIGRHIPVFAAGNPLTIAVSADYAPFWVAISSDTGLKLTAVKSFAQSPCAGQPVSISVTDSITFLVNTGGGGDPGAKSSAVTSGAACGGSVPSAPTPAAVATAPPGATPTH